MEIRICDNYWGHGEYYNVERFSNVTLSDIKEKYLNQDYILKAINGETITSYSSKQFTCYCYRNIDVVYVDDEKKMIWLDKDSLYKCDECKTAKQKLYLAHKREEAKKYLASPFVKGWLNKMHYTIKESETGEKYLFLAILAGYNKLSRKSFQKIVEAIYAVNFDDDFCMQMWIGGKVNWTMFYSQHFSHINGRETYFCHGVAKDDYSPEDWERDMAKLKANKNGESVTAYDYVSYLLTA